MKPSKREHSLESLIDRLLLILKIYTPIDWSVASSGLWEKSRWHSGCIPLFEEIKIELHDLKNVDEQKKAVEDQ